MKSAFTVSEIIDQRPLSRFQLLTISLCGVVLVLDGFDAQSIGFLAPSIAKTLNVSVSTFGPVFGAALFGLMVSAMAAGPIADRIGRKWPVIISTIVFGTFTILTARARSFEQLILFRFLTGLGLGAAMPNVVALTAEYSPKRLISIFVSTLFCGMPLGVLLSGLIGSVLLSRWGWQSVLYVGGIVPFIVATILIKALPESVRFLNVSGAAPERIARIMGRISPELADLQFDSNSSENENYTGISVKYLFAGGRAFGTFLLWIPFFMNLLTIYFVASWLPALLQQAGMPPSAGVSAILFFGLGGVIGSLAEGHLMNGFGTLMVLAVEFVLSALLVGSMAFSVSFSFVMTMTFILGFTVQGAQAGLNALVAIFYPTAIRATGVGWALGVGRVGSIVGPMLGGVMLSIGWQPRQILLAGAIPALCATAAIMFTSWRYGNSIRSRPKLDPSAFV